MNYDTSDSTFLNIRGGGTPFTIGVYQARATLKQVGIAFYVGRSARAVAEWSLEVRGVGVPGTFVVNDGRFEPLLTDLGSDSGIARRDPGHVAG